MLIVVVKVVKPIVPKIQFHGTIVHEHGKILKTHDKKSSGKNQLEEIFEAEDFSMGKRSLLKEFSILLDKFNIDQKKD